MITLEDFNNLKKQQKDFILMLLTTTIFNYINIYFVARHFIDNTDWFVPFLFSLCLSITQSFLSLLSSFYLNDKLLCYLHIGSLTLIILIKNIIISSIVAFYFYFNSHSLLYFFITIMTVYTVINFVFVIIYITDSITNRRSSVQLKEKHEPPTNAEDSR